MGIISWVECTLREGFVWGGLTLIDFWKSVKGGLVYLERKKNNFKIIYLELFGEKKNIKKNFTFYFFTFLLNNWFLKRFFSYWTSSPRVPCPTVSSSDILVLQPQVLTPLFCCLQF